MPEQYATRLKLGVVTPGTNTTLEPDCHSLCPPGVTVHTARIPIQNKKISGAAAYEDHVKAMRAGIASAVSQVITCGPGHLVMGVALEAFWGGLEGTAKLQLELEELAGTDVTMGSLAMHRALQKLQVKRIAILTPHMPAGDEQVRKWFEQAGYEIVSFIGLQCTSPRAIAEVTPDELRGAIASLNTDDAEAIIQVGTNLQFRLFAPAAEKLIGKPVLALNTVMMWDALRVNGITDSIAEAGLLLCEH